MAPNELAILLEEVDEDPPALALWRDLGVPFGWPAINEAFWMNVTAFEPVVASTMLGLNGQLGARRATVFCLALAKGMSMAVIFLPSIVGGLSTLPMSASLSMI